jgi:hypothetical protein
MREDGYVVPGADVFAGEGKVGELDLVGWSGRTLFAGEAKMTSGWFTRESVAEDVKKSVRLKADVHISACLADIDVSMRESIESICSDHKIESRILLGSEVFER